jgi:hypothetical protein
MSAKSLQGSGTACGVIRLPRQHGQRMQMEALPDCMRSFDVDHEHELGELHDRQIIGFS